MKPIMWSNQIDALLNTLYISRDERMGEQEIVPAAIVFRRDVRYTSGRSRRAREVHLWWSRASQ